MDPGDGAQRQAERAAAAVDEARRRLAIAQKRQHAWQAGAEGERRTAQALAFSAAGGWVVLHDLHWPGRPFANIDHIAVGPGGVVVIDSKNWSGRVDVRDGVLRQNWYRRTKKCESAVTSVAACVRQHRLHPADSRARRCRRSRTTTGLGRARA